MLRRVFTSASSSHATAPFAAAAATSAARSYTCDGLDFLLNPTPEHAALRETAARFAKERVAPQAREFDLKGELNRPLFDEYMSLGFGGIPIPAESGGAGLDATAVALVTHEICRYDPGFSLSAGAHAILFINNFFWSATEEQKQRYLAPALSGEFIGGMGMTEPGAGTDVVAMQTTAKKTDGGDYVINGSKQYITNAPVGDVFIVYAKNVSEKKITAFLVERKMKGFSSGPALEKLGHRSSPTGPLYFDNVRVPKENVLGGNTNGLIPMMRNLEIERLLLAAMSVGIADQCVDLMIKYGAERKSFGKTINNYGQIQRYIAESFAKTEAAKTLTYAVSRSIAPGNQNRIGSDAAKLFAAPVGKEVADNAIQVMGGMGYSRDMPVERLWRDAKLVEIGGGTLEAHHKNLIKDLTDAMK